MIGYDEAVARILANLTPLPAVELPVLDARGLVLSADLTTPIDLPPFSNSQMDGFALVAADTVSAAAHNPIRLDLVGEVAAGASSSVSVRSGTAAKIFTGAAVPPGADSVVPIEDTRSVVDGDAVDILVEAERGQFVRPAGEDFRAGDVVLSRGSRMTPAAIAMACAAGHGVVPVHRRPRVCIIGTGDELVPPGAVLGPGQIHDSNSFAIAAQVEDAGGVCQLRLHAQDTVEALNAAMLHAQHANVDLIITCGGVSVGDHDLVKQVFSSRGEIDFWRVAIRPGKPFAFGKAGDCLFFGLPGNPASALVTFELFVRPALIQLMGRTDSFRPVVTATLTETVTHGAGRRSFMRAIVSTNADGAMEVRLAGGQGSHRFSSMVAANALLIVPEDVEMLPAMASVHVVLLG